MTSGPTIRFRTFVLAYVFLSGFCSLTYQVIWERTLKSVFGGDVISASITVSIFLLGLGLGGFLFRTIQEKALLVLAGLELLTGLFGACSFGLIGGIGKFASSAFSGAGEGASFAAVVLGSLIFLIVPTLLMGGTLPLIFESFVPSVEANTKFIGLVYGINVLGAFAGTILPPLVFGTWGLPATLRAAALMNVALAFALGGLYFKGGRSAEEAPPAPPGPVRAVRGVASVRFLSGFAFLSGFIALSLEILFIRFLGLVQGQSAYSFPIILSAVLLSMSLGSIVWSAIKNWMKSGLSKILPFFLQAALGSILPFSILLIGPVLRNKYAAYFNFAQMFKHFGDLLENGQFLPAARLFAYFGLPLLIFVVPVVFVSGGIFPSLIKSLSEDNRSLGNASGTVYFWNSLGCALGSLATGFILIPGVGWYGSAVLISGLSVLGGMVGIAAAGRASSGETAFSAGRVWVRRASFLALAVLPAGLFILSDRNIKYEIATGKYTTYVCVEAYREGMTGVAAAVREKVKNKTIIEIYGDGFLMSELPSHRFAYIANLPRFQEGLHSVLVLGLGGGQNIADLLKDPRVRRVVVVNWSREIIDLVSTRPVAKFNEDPFADQRLRIVRSDAKQAVKIFARESLKFDAIINNLCFPSWSGAGGVTSVQFFRSIRDILNPDGFYYHVPNASDPREWDLVLNTLASVFGHVAIHNKRIMVCGEHVYAPLESRVKELLTAEMLHRTAPYLIPADKMPDEYYAVFMAQVQAVDKEELPNVGILTDEVPAAEYPISVPSLWRKIVKGLKNPNSVNLDQSRR